MLANFGWKAAVAVTVNAMIVTFMFQERAQRLKLGRGNERTVPHALMAGHVLFASPG